MVRDPHIAVAVHGLNPCFSIDGAGVHQQVMQGFRQLCVARGIRMNRIGSQGAVTKDVGDRAFQQWNLKLFGQFLIQRGPGRSGSALAGTAIRTTGMSRSWA